MLNISIPLVQAQQECVCVFTKRPVLDSWTIRGIIIHSCLKLETAQMSISSKIAK